MTRWWLLAAIAAVVGVAGEARAYEEKQTSLELVWKDVPAERVRKAVVPGAEIRMPMSGSRHFTIALADGHQCATMATGNELVLLTCGRANGFYRLMQSPGRPVKLEWATTEDKQ